MSFIHTVGYTYKTPEGTVISVSNNYTADGDIAIDDAIPPSTTNKNYALRLFTASVKSLLISCDQAVTLKTNSSGSPADTLAVKAGVPVIWDTDNLNSLPFSTDVTQIFVTNSGGNTANFKVRALTTI